MVSSAVVARESAELSTSAFVVASVVFFFLITPPGNHPAILPITTSANMARTTAIATLATVMIFLSLGSSSSS